MLARAKAEGFARLQLIWADRGYRGLPLAAWTIVLTACLLTIVERAANQIGFQLLPRRWVVARTLAWLGRYRHLSKDYEVCPQTSEAFNLCRYGSSDAQTLGPSDRSTYFVFKKHALRQ